MTIDCDFILQLQEHLAIETNFYCQSVLKGAILQFIWLLAEKNLIIYELLSYNSSMYSFSAKVIQSFLSSSIEKKTYLKVAGRNYLWLFCPFCLLPNVFLIFTLTYCTFIQQSGYTYQWSEKEEKECKKVLIY